MRLLTEYLSIKSAKSKIIATDDTLFKIVKDSLNRLGPEADLNFIDVSQVTLFYINYNTHDECSPGLFQSTGFCGDVSKWNVSNGTNFAMMFMNCNDFNCDISMWDMKKATNISSMFVNCTIFNQPIWRWDIRKLTKAYQTFRNCKSFNQDLSSWARGINITKKFTMNAMFANCTSFEQDLSSWDLRQANTSQVIDMFSGSLMENNEKFYPKLPTRK